MRREGQEPKTCRGGRAVPFIARSSPSGRDRLSPAIRRAKERLCPTASSLYLLPHQPLDLVPSLREEDRGRQGELAYPFYQTGGRRRSPRRMSALALAGIAVMIVAALGRRVEEVEA